MLLFLAMAARRRGWRLANYLGLAAPTAREVLLAFVATVGVIGALDLVATLGGREIVQRYDLSEYGKAAEAIWLYGIGLCLAAPIFEESCFRGFLFRGWAGSPLGPLGAIALSSALWTAFHTQYDFFYLLQIFAFGLLLGWLRWRTGSIVLPIASHSLSNAVDLAKAALRTAGLI